MTQVSITRSIEEITISAKINMQDMIGKAMALGKDFSDAKELLGHGKFLPWLESLGVSSSTANNYMKVAREIAPGSRLASLPYSKALALLAAPAEEREALAAEADDKSAAEIRRLIEERNKAAEAANAETTRADQAEADAKRYYDENGSLRNKISVLENKVESIRSAGTSIANERDKYRNEYNKQKQYSEALKEELEKKTAELLTAENNVVEVEVAPADYEALKKDRADLMEAAAQAEERAAQLEAELEEARSQSDDKPNPAKTLRVAVTAFLADCGQMINRPDLIKRDQKKIEGNIDILESWCAAMRETLQRVVDGNGTVVIE